MEPAQSESIRIRLEPTSDIQWPLSTVSGHEGRTLYLKLAILWCAHHNLCIYIMFLILSCDPSQGLDSMHLCEDLLFSMWAHAPVPRPFFGEHAKLPSAPINGHERMWASSTDCAILGPKANPLPEPPSPNIVK